MSLFKKTQVIYDSSAISFEHRENHSEIIEVLESSFQTEVGIQEYSFPPGHTLDDPESKFSSFPALPTAVQDK